jgi:hypothetical protein
MFGVIGNALLDLAVTHELGHAICHDQDERRADDYGRDLREKKPVACGKGPGIGAPQVLVLLTCSWSQFCRKFRPRGATRSEFRFLSWKKRTSARMVSASNFTRIASQRSCTVSLISMGKDC